MTRHLSILSTVLGLMAAGCASGPPVIDQLQPEAVNMAVRRGQFEMNCKAAAGQVMSRESIQPLVMNPRWGGTVRDEYTVGVAGCGKRATYVVICSEDASSCFAGAGRME